MTLNLDALNPCLKIKADLEKSLKKLDAIKATMGPVKNALQGISDAGARIDEGLLGTVNASLAQGFGKINTDLAAVGDSVSGLAGSCLDSVTAGLKAGSKSSQGAVTDIMGKVGSCVDVTELGGVFGDVTSQMLSGALGPVSDIMGKVTSMTSITQSLGIEGMLKGMDERLGCMADSTCGDLINPSVIDGYMNKINGFLTEYALDPTGKIDVANVLDACGIGGGIATSITDSANLVQDATIALGTTAKSAIAAATPKLIDFKKF